MSRILAIARQTFWEGIRMRIVLVFMLILLVVLFGLPTAMRGDETLAGRVQTLLAYSFSAVGIFASMATVFFSCYTLAGEIKNNVIHLLVTKPVSRFEILAGKWLGVNLLSLLLVGLCSVMIYLFALQIARGKAEFERDAVKLRDVVWTARTSVQPKPPDFTAELDSFIKDRASRGEATLPEPLARAEKQRELTTDWRTVKQQTFSLYEFRDLPTPESLLVVQVTFKAQAVPMTLSERLPILWQFLDPETRVPLMPEPMMTEGRSGETHEFLINAGAVVKKGTALLAVINPSGPDGPSIVFDDTRGLQIHYKVASFEANFVKSAATLYFRLAFLSAVGLFFGVFVSFPVACMCTLTFYLVGLGHDWWWEAVGGNVTVYSVSVDPYGYIGPAIRVVLLPILAIFFPNFSALDGTDKLIAGESIDWMLLLRSLGHTLAFGGAMLLTIGWYVFSQREIAEVQV